MHKIKLELDLEGYRSKVEVDGIAMESFVHSLTVSAEAKRSPVLNLRINFIGLSINSEGDVFFDGSLIPDNLARQFYQQLQERFA